MKKTAGFKMVEDRSDRVQAFVNQGGQGETPAVPEPARRFPDEKPQRLNVDLPPVLHGRFKAACAVGRVKMAAIVTQLVEEWTANQENAGK